MLIGRNMKTAISIEDELLRRADASARDMGLSRSRFFSIAVEDFMARRRQDQMLDDLNKVYGGGIDSAEKAVLGRMKTKFRRAIRATR